MTELPPKPNRDELTERAARVRLLSPLSGDAIRRYSK